ncbi:HIT family protein [Candidatus Daviesbacteria bacterium]|nr:HIT family protein [Candidatus Daviesbacteria bacterium]
MKECLSCQSYPQDPNFIYQTKYWKIFLHPDQAYLGRCIVTSSRHIGDLADLNLAEWADYYLVIKQLEGSLKKAFRVTLFNWGCLMNNAYQEKPYNPHVHWHLRPRYNHQANIGGSTFEDLEFGNHYTHDRSQIVTPEVQQLIINKIRENLNEKVG